MKKIFTALSVIVLGIIAFFLLFGDALTELGMNPFDYARITDVDYTAIVVDEPNGNGKIYVTERLTFDIHAASNDNLFWELWRDLPEAYIDGVKVDYTVNFVKQILEDGTEIVYGQSSKLYWEDEDYTGYFRNYGPGKWYHSEGPYAEHLRQYECVFFYVDGLYREEVVFEIQYEMHNAALRYADCSELYITPYSEGSINHLNSFQGTILVPTPLMPDAGNYTANTYGTNANSFSFTESDTANPGYHTFAFSLDKTQLAFKPYNEYLEFSLVSYGEDKHKFTQNASVNDYYNDNVLDELQEEQEAYEAAPTLFRTIGICVLLASAFVTLLVLRFAFGIDKRMKRKHIFYEPEMQIDYFRDIPSEMDPNFATELVFSKHERPKDVQDAYPAVVLSLVRKEYIALEKISEAGSWSFSNVNIVLKYNPNKPAVSPIEENSLYMIYQPEQLQEPTKPMKTLTPTEELYFSLILRHASGDELSFCVFQNKIAQDYENTNAFVKNTKNSMLQIGIQQGYFQKADYKQPAEQVKRNANMLVLMGVLILLAGNIISYQTRLGLAFGAFFVLGIGCIAGAVHLYKRYRNYVLFTQFGEDEYAKWRGLYHFLNSETLMRERTVVELPLWEQYLVYATAFGIADKVIAAIQVRCPNIEQSPILSNPYYCSRSFHHGVYSFSGATRSAFHSARSGGYGGHGGYGGGGRGGGGGGGGH